MWFFPQSCVEDQQISNKTRLIVPAISLEQGTGELTPHNTSFLDGHLSKIPSSSSELDILKKRNFSFDDHQIELFEPPPLSKFYCEHYNKVMVGFLVIPGALRLVNTISEGIHTEQRESLHEVIALNPWKIPGFCSAS
jgi:hypothetical protein